MSGEVKMENKHPVTGEVSIEEAKEILFDIMRKDDEYK